MVGIAFECLDGEDEVSKSLQGFAIHNVSHEVKVKAANEAEVHTIFPCLFAMVIQMVASATI